MIITLLGKIYLVNLVNPLLPSNVFKSLFWFIATPRYPSSGTSPLSPNDIIDLLTI